MARNIVYHPRYNIGFLGLEHLHPFDARKYGKAWKLLRSQMGSGLRRSVIQTPNPITFDDLLEVHSPSYLAQLGNSSYLAGALEVPPLQFVPAWLLDRYVLRPMRWATMGSVVAAREAVSSGFAVNLAGGYHHAKPSAGEGFCIYSDIALIVSRLKSEGLFGDGEKIAYIDLDAHQGNGVCHQFMTDERVSILDMYNSEIYPKEDVEARARVDWNLPLPREYSGAKYLQVLRENLPAFLDGLASLPGSPPLAIYNAGTDVFAGDPLGGLELSSEAILERDLLVVRACRKRGIPVVMLLAGGYTRQSYRLIARSVQTLLERYGQINEAGTS